MTDSDNVSGGSKEHKQSLDFGNNCNQNSSEMAKIHHIPNDLAFFVLSKLPLKSLKRFRCVCQTWALLFENQYFMIKFRTNFISRCHHSDYIDTPLLLHEVILSHDLTQYCSFYSLSGKRYENRVKLAFPNPFQYENPFFRFFDCDNITGIVCLRLDKTLVLWKPTTDEFKVIPLSFDESLSPYREPSIFYHGFGYDAIGDDIKIIRYIEFCRISSRVFQQLDVREQDVPWKEISFEPIWEIYSLRCNSWTKRDFNIPKCRFGDSNERLYNEGVCHWWSQSNDGEHFLVSFNLSNEIVITTPIPLDLPPDIDPYFNFLFLRKHLVMLNGSISSILWYTSTFHISVLGELGVKESWTKLFVVGPFLCIQRVVGTGKKGDIFFKTKDGKLVLLDLSTGIVEDMGFKGGNVYAIAIFKENHILMTGIHL